MANVYDINLTNDLKNAFIKVLRIVFSSDFLKEYKYNTDPKTSKIFINTSFAQQPEKKPAIIISANGGSSFYGLGAVQKKYNVPVARSGTGYGAGASANWSNVSQEGADGTDGIVIITEYK